MTLTVNSVTGATRDSYQNSMNKLLGLRDRFRDLWRLPENMFLSELTDCHLEDHKEARMTEGFKANSINIEIRFLKRVNNLCRKRYRTNQDLDFEMLKGFSKSRVISPEEEQAIIAALLAKGSVEDNVAYQKAYDLFVYLMETGVRLSEALKIEWADIDMEGMTIDNYNHKTKKGVYVPISNRLADVLKRLHNQPQPFMNMDRAVKNLRTVITNECVSSSRMLAEKGKPTIHSCRDTYATRLLNKGVPLEVVSHLLGHASLVQTQKYAKFNKKATADVARHALNG
jgi:integrase